MSLKPASLLNVSVARLIRGWTCIVGFLILANVAVLLARHQFGITSVDLFSEFDLDEENNLPTFFSAAFLVLASGLSLLIAMTTPRSERRSQRRFWFLLAFALFYVGVDEAASLHERASAPVRELFDVSGWFYFAWVLPAALCLTLFGLICLRPLLSLDPTTRNRLILAGVVFLSGTLGMEVISGHHFAQFENDNLTYALMTTVEESLEMIGVGILVFGLLDHLRRHAGVVSFRFDV